MIQHNETKVGIIGAGSWGLALAQHLSVNALAVQVWGRNAEELEAISKSGESRKYLPDVPLSKSISFISSLKDLAKNSDVLIFSAPSSSARSLAELLKPDYKKNIPLVCCAKGLEQDTHLRTSEVLSEVLEPSSMYVLSGPSFALEVAEGMPTAVVLASSDSKSEEHQKIVSLFHRGTLRVYSSSDLIGVELGGILKNIISFAAGVSDGLGLGSNARAALLTRGLKEIRELLSREGARQETVMGLSGLGDLILTATGDLSRNRRFGILLGEGMSIEQAKMKIGQTIETITTAKAARELSKKHKLESPIIEQVHAVLNGNSSPGKALRDLLTREQKQE
jgi:glycerol-3-phosphate dehydrogenase (NAD(P)+)